MVLYLHLDLRGVPLGVRDSFHEVCVGATLSLRVEAAKTLMAEGTQVALGASPSAVENVYKLGS